VSLAGACYKIRKARGRPASRRTSLHRRCACPAPPSIGRCNGVAMAASRYLVNPKQQSAEERGHARFALNLQCAFGDLASKLERAYAQPARDAADARKQHEDALIALL
jgi:hypothetical protein